MTSAARTVATRVRTSFGALVAITLVGTCLTTSTAVAEVTRPRVTSDKASASTLKVDWTDVKGAASYRVQYSTSPSFDNRTTTLPAQGDPVITHSDATIDGLSTGTVYYVRVAEVSSDGKVGTYSAATAATPTYDFAAPGDLYRSKVDRDSMTVSWKAVDGAPGYTLRVSSKGKPTTFFTTTSTSVGLTGLRSSTAYTIRAYVVKPAAGSTPETRLSADSPEVVQSTTRYPLATPDGFQETSQGSSSVGLAWTAVAGAPSGSGYRVSYALNGAQTDHQKTTGVFKGTSGALTGLKSDTTYFATIYLVGSDGKRLTASTDFIVAKSLIPRGTISGRVSGVTGSDLTAAAYDTRDGGVAQAVTVGSDNRYTLNVRPGTYKVQLMYTGGGSYASAWARSGSDGGWTYGTGSTIAVVGGKTTTAPDVDIHKGHVVSGKVVDRGGAPVRDVDLTAVAVRGSERDVISLTRSSAGGSDDGKDESGLRSGEFRLEGLNTGSYWIRAVYSGDGFRTESVPLGVNTDLGVRVVLDTLPFRKRYGAYLRGTSRVGRTMSVTAIPWLAGTFPTTRASMSYQWKRNGGAIKGATHRTYALGAADRGKRISVTVTARRYGYTTGDVTTKSRLVS